MPFPCFNFSFAEQITFPIKKLKVEKVKTGDETVK